MRGQIFKNKNIAAPLLAFLIAAAALYAAVESFALPVSPVLSTGCILCGIAAAYAAEHAQKLHKRKQLIYSVLTLVLIVLMLAANELFTDGIAAVINQFIDAFKQLHPYNYEILKVESRLSECVSLVVCMAALAGGAAAFEYVRQPHKCAAAAMILTDLAILLLFSELMTLSVLIVLVLKSAAVWLLYVGAGCGQQREAVQTAAMRVWLRASLIFLLLFAVGSALLPISNTELVEKAGNGLTALTDELRYGNNGSDGLTDGDLTKAGSLKRSTENVLKLTMSEPQSYYLRGFVGERYETNTWKTLSEADKESLYDNADLFYWLHKDGFFGQNQIVNAANAAGNIFTEEKADKSINRVTVENLNASSKYLYLPYELAESSCADEKAIGDAYTQADGISGTRSYSCEATENIIVKYQKLASGLQKQKKAREEATVTGEAGSTDSVGLYLEDEEAYNAFVYENYTELPADIAQYLAEKFGDYVIENGERHFDYQMAKQNILYYLGKSVKYGEETDEAEGEIDFVLKFLDGSKTGYDVHYATAAVMMFRYYGIPARYVEGYLITKEDAKEMKADEPFYIDGTHAHAWAEYYQDGVGWLPFEVTPSYLSVMSKMESYRDISGLLGKTAGSKKAENQEEQQVSEPENPAFEMFWIKHKVTIIFAAAMLLLALLIGLFVSWLMHERKKTMQRKAAFMDDDVSCGIRNIYDYMMDVLRADGLKTANENPLAYEDFIAASIAAAAAAADESTAEAAASEEELRKKYRQVNAIWEEAKFSRHTMSESQRQEVLELNAAVWDSIWQKAGILQRIKLKYVYFL